MQPFSENFWENCTTFVKILNRGSVWSQFFRMVLADNFLEVVCPLTTSYNLELLGGKTGVNSCCPFEQIPGRVICAARSLQGALLNYNVLRGFLPMVHINLLSPPSGRLNLFQVNCCTPSSRCQCSIQLKQITTRKMKPNVPSKHWDKHPTWCRDPKYNVSWRGSTEGHKCTGILVQASWSLSLHARKFHQSDSRETRGHVTHYWQSPSTLHGGKKKVRTCTHKHTKHWFLSEFHTAGSVKTCVNLQH